MSSRLLFAAAFLLAMSGPSSAAMAAGGSAPLAKLCDEYWQGYLAANPTTATSVGDSRYDDRLNDIKPAGIEKEKARLEGVLAKAKAIDEKSLTPADRLTRTALITEVSGQLAEISCGFEEWVVDPLGGPQVEFMSLPDYTRIDTPADAAKFVKRVWAMGGYLEDHVRNLERGLGKNRTASHDAVTKVIDQLNGMISGPAESLAVWKPSTAEHKTWQPADRYHFSNDLKTAIDSALMPSLKRYHDVLQT